MPSLLSHPAVPLALAAMAGRRLVPPPLLAAGVGMSLLPDLDGIAFLFDVPWHSPFSHRGLTHSIAFALLCALLVSLQAQRLKADRLRAFAFLAVSMASHGLLDACTNRGGGVSLLWPLDNTKLAFGFRPIQTAPLSLERLFSGEGLLVLQSELLWVWLPLAALVFGVRLLQRLLPAHWQTLEQALLAGSAAEQQRRMR